MKIVTTMACAAELFGTNETKIRRQVKRGDREQVMAKGRPWQSLVCVDLAELGDQAEAARLRVDVAEGNKEIDRLAELLAERDEQIAEMRQKQTLRLELDTTDVRQQIQTLQLEIDGQTNVLADADRRVALLEGERVALWGIVDPDGTQRELGRSLVDLLREKLSLSKVAETQASSADSVWAAYNVDLAQMQRLREAMDLPPGPFERTVTEVLERIAGQAERNNAANATVVDLEQKLEHQVGRAERYKAGWDAFRKQAIEARDVARRRDLPFADSASLPMLIAIAADRIAEEAQRAHAMAERAAQLKAQLDELMARHETLRQAARAQAVTVTHLLDVAGVDAQA